jgi:DNA-binding transcriptional regulator GbsR (MarR family)
MGVAAATSGLLNQLQGRIFGLLYLREEPLSLDAIADDLQQSKSNVSVQVRGLVEWHLVRRVRVEGSRKDHYEAATDFWRVMQEIMERRFRWNLRQVIAAADEAERALGESDLADAEFLGQRLTAIRTFFRAVDAGVAAFTQGRVFAPDAVRGALRIVTRR